MPIVYFCSVVGKQQNCFYSLLSCSCCALIYTKTIYPRAYFNIVYANVEVLCAAKQ